MIKKFILPVAFLLLISPATVLSYWVWSPEEGKFINPVDDVGDAAEEQYNYAMQFFKEANLDEAAKQLESLLEKYPAAPIAHEAQYRLGTIREEQGDYIKAFDAYKVLVQSYPQSDRLNEVIEREYRIGNLFLSGKKGKLMGLKILPSLPNAIEIFNHIVQNAPYSEYGDKAQFRLGLSYRKAGKYEESLKAFEDLIEQYPQSDLVSDARFQLADTSFQRSAVQFRDQRALEEASQQVDRFLTTDSDSKSSERAARLRQEIDEKNAEKNYRVGAYYEKTNYLKSAIIYYSDVARRYPHTVWGEKAADKLSVLKSPAEFLSEERAEIEERIAETKTQLETAKADDLDTARLKRRMERLEEKADNLEKSKKQSLESRRKDIKRREGELKEKFKNLRKKEKLLKKNPSDDLKKALDRWHASLEEEQAILVDEKRQLADWHHELGVNQGLSLSFLPFVDEPASEVEKVREMDAEKYYKVATQKKNLLSEKELLYKQYGEVLMYMQKIDRAAGELQPEPGALDALTAKGSEGLEETEADLKQLEEETAALRKTLEEKTELYEENYGKGWLDWVTASAGLVTKPVTKTVSFINPFGGKGENLEELAIEELLERRMHLREKIAAQRGLVDTLSQAFDHELAVQEQTRLIKQLEGAQEIDPAELRKSIRAVEKDLRSRYEEIKDRHETKRELLDELDDMVKRSEQELGTAESASVGIAKPFKKAAFFSKAFLFGLPNKDVTLTKTVRETKMSAANQARAEEIQNKLEEESILIEVRNQEIIPLRRKLETLKAQASLAGGFKFRSVFVELPYSFIRDAVDSANRLIPKKDREEALIGLLDKESQELEALKGELSVIDAAIKTQSGQTAPARVASVTGDPDKSKTEPDTEQKSEAAVFESVPDEKSLQMTIKTLSDQIAIKEKAYEQQVALMDTQKKVLDQELDLVSRPQDLVKRNRALTDDEKKLAKELEEIQDSLRKLISEEHDLENQEFNILSKRVDKINTLLKKTLSTALTSDLEVERERLEGRLAEIQMRQNFLSKELERFAASEMPSKP